MKRFACLLLLGLAWRCLAVDVQFAPIDSANRPALNRSFTLYPLNAPFPLGNNQVTRDRVSTNTGSGTFIVSNLVAAAYRTELQGNYGSTTNWYDFTGASGLVMANNYLTAPTNGPGGSTAYSTSVSDARYWQKSVNLVSNGESGLNLSGSFSDAAGSPLVSSNGGTSFNQLLEEPTIQSPAFTTGFAAPGDISSGGQFNGSGLGLTNVLNVWARFPYQATDYTHLQLFAMSSNILNGDWYSNSFTLNGLQHIPTYTNATAPGVALFNDFSNSGWTFTNAGGVIEFYVPGNDTWPIGPSDHINFGWANADFQTFDPTGDSKFATNSLSTMAQPDFLGIGSGAGQRHALSTNVENYLYSVMLFGVKADGSDDTTNMQRAIDAGKPLSLPAFATITIYSNLFLKTGTVIIGSGNSVIAAPAAGSYFAPGHMLTCPTTDPSSGIVLKNFEVDPISSVHHLGGISLGTDFKNSEYSGLTVNGAYSNSFTLFGNESFSSTMTEAHSQVHNLSALNCQGYGFLFQASGGKDAEYTPATQLYAINCSTGIVLQAGNVVLTACQMLHGGVGFYIASGENSAHGVLSDSLINHNTSYGVLANSFITGFLISNCQICSPGIRLDGCAGVDFDHDTFATCNGTMFTFTSVNGTGWNFIRSCKYSQAFGGRTGVADGLFLDNQDGTIRSQGAYSATFSGDTDGSYQMPATNAPLTKAYLTNQSWFYKSNNTQWVIGTALNTTNWTGGFTNKLFGP